MPAGKLGKTRRQIRRANRGWSFSPRASSKRTTSSNHSAWRSVSSKGKGLKRSLKTRKSRK